MGSMKSVEGLDQILLADSYVLSIFRRDGEVVFQMEFTLARSGLGHLAPGELVFPGVEREEWHLPNGQPASLAEVHKLARRYQSGRNPDGSREPPDMGCVNSICFNDGCWQVDGDWGSCAVWTKLLPKTVLDPAACV